MTKDNQAAALGLVERLRAKATASFEANRSFGRKGKEWAIETEVEWQAALSIERMSRALEPFRAMGAVLEARSRMTFGRVVPDDEKVCESGGEAGYACLKMRDFRAARAALSAQGEEG